MKKLIALAVLSLTVSIAQASDLLNEFLGGKYICYGTRVHSMPAGLPSQPPIEYMNVLVKFDVNPDGSTGAPLSFPALIDLSELKAAKVSYGVSADRRMISLQSGDVNFKKLLNARVRGTGSMQDVIRRGSGRDLYQTQIAADGVGLRIPYFASRSYQDCRFGCATLYVKERLQDLTRTGLKIFVKGMNVNRQDKSENYECYLLTY